MLTQTTPGVYFETADVRSPIAALSTSVAGFVGLAARGPLHVPVKVESWVQFVSTFGGHMAHGYLGYAVEGFFANGGRACWVVRVADPAAAREAEIVLFDGQGRAALRLIASSPGLWAHHLTAAVSPSGVRGFHLRLALPTGERESWSHLTLAEAFVDLPNEDNRAALRLATFGPGIGRYEVTAEVRPQEDGRRFSLTVRVSRLASDGDEPPEPEGGVQPPAETSLEELTLSPGDPGYAPEALAGHPELRRWLAALDLFPPLAAGGVRVPLRTVTRRFESEPRNVERLLGHPERGSRLARAEVLAHEGPFPENSPARLAGRRLEGGREGLGTLRVEHLSGEGSPPEEAWGLRALEAVDEVSIVAMPDIMPQEVTLDLASRRRPRCHVAEPGDPPPPEGSEELPRPFNDLEVAVLQNALVGHCRHLADRFAILDARPGQRDAQEVIAWRRQFDSSFGALYYPWLRVRDPLGRGGALRAVPPSGHVAGIYARSDLRTGVHQPPANERLEGANDVTVAIDEVAHGDLNAAAVNLIRGYTGRGLLLMGARTLASDAALRYVNVRRLLTMIVESLEEELQWSVFEANDADLWALIQRDVTHFLLGLWRRGMLDGASREEAFFVKCDATTNPPEETALGRVTCLVGLRPPWPAEFIVVRIGRSEGRLEIMDIEGGLHG